MGCILSIFKKKHNHMDELLFSTNNYCYLCGKQFRNSTKFNKHILECNKKYRNKTPPFIY